MSRPYTTAQQAVDILTRAVQERGADYVYKPVRHTQDDGGGTSCMYVHGEEPGCLVGLAMHRAGVTLGQLRDNEDRPAPFMLDALELADEHGYFANTMSVAQSRQDAGATWGEALRHAVSYAAAAEVSPESEVAPIFFTHDEIQVSVDA